ncbi:hypothetical protein CTI14_35935 [Methylobacterium radiotolerans]|nr:hypothetical protein CTI14_35935 [Methylobacterium radiotolerans]
MLRAGETAGTNSYFYTVKSTRTGSTAQGLIVLTVTEGTVADQPVVTDTVLTRVTGTTSWTAASTSSRTGCAGRPATSRHSV